MKRIIFLIIVLFCVTTSIAQTVSIYLWTGFFISADTRIVTVYETAFGVGNVTVTVGNNTADFSSHDIVVVNDIVASHPNNLSTDLVTYIQSGGHVVLSTEGTVTANGDQLMSTVWNNLTGNSITETGYGATGTSSPPRFHNSNGPWGLSPDTSLNGSTNSYASFGNLPAINVTHQRDLSPPTCGNIEGVCAVYPSKPTLGSGTLYIQGEVCFPFYVTSGATRNHAEALAQFHYVMLTGNQTQLDALNTWGNNPIGANFLNDTTICEGALTPYIVSGPDSASYSWQDRGGTILATTQTYSISDTGKYYLYVTGNQTGCDGLDSMIVSYDTIGFDTILTPTCANVSGGAIQVLNVTSGNLTNPINYQLDNNTPVSTSTFNGVSSGIHQVKVTDGRGCTDSLSVNIQSLASPIANFNADTVCFGNLTSFTDLSTTSGTLSQWEWFIDGTTAGTQNTTYTYTAASSLTVKLKVTDNSTCTDSITKTVELYALPTANFNADTVCFGSLTNFTDLSSPSGTITQWEWLIDGNSITTPNTTYTYNGASSLSTQLKITDVHGCEDSITKLVELFESPTANFSSTSECLGNTTQFTDLSTQTGSINLWEWTIDRGVSNLQNPSYTYTGTSILAVTLKVTNNEGCVDSVTNNVTVFPTPIADFIFDTVCFGDLTSFTDLSTPSGLISQWEWQINGNTLTTQNPTYSYTSASNLSTQLKVTHNNGCVDSISKIVVLHPNPTVNFTATTVCLNSPTVFTNLTTAEGKLYNSNYMFNWQFDNGSSSTLAAPNTTYALAGNYDVQLYATTDKGCTNDTLIQVTVYDNPIADFSSTSVCFNQITDLTDQSSIPFGTITSLEWKIEGNSINAINVAHTFTNDGSIPVSLIATSNNGCKDTVVNNVTVYSLPVVDFTTNLKEIDNINNAVSFTNQSSGGIFYIWLFDETTLVAQENPTHSFDIKVSCAPIYNKLIVETGDGCVDSITKPINVVGNLLAYVPSAFTPDGDGINDFFKPELTDVEVKDYFFQVFNKWGELIFQTDNLSSSWDGLHNNSLVQQDVYVWKIRAKTSCKNQTNQLSGHVTLVR